MRTTLTIDDNILKSLRKMAQESDRSFKDVVNEVLVRGLSATERGDQVEPYRLVPASMGAAQPAVDLNKALQLGDALEDQAIAEKLERRK